MNTPKRRLILTTNLVTEHMRIDASLLTMRNMTSTMMFGVMTRQEVLDSDKNKQD